MTMPPSYHLKENHYPHTLFTKFRSPCMAWNKHHDNGFPNSPISYLLKVFKHSNANHSLFVKVVSTYFIALLVYVDDIVIVSNSDEQVEKLKVHLGKLKYF